MIPAMQSRLRPTGWLILGSFALLIATVAAFGSVAIRTPEFSALRTVEEVAAWVSERGSQWVPLNVGLMAGVGLTFVALILIARALMGTQSRAPAMVGLIALVASLVFLAFSSYLLIGLAAGPRNLPPFVAEQTVAAERAVIGTVYEHFAGVLSSIGLALVGFSLFQTGLLRRTGLAVAILAVVLTVVGVLFGAVPGPVVLLALPIGVGIVRQRPQEPNAALNPA